MKKFARFALIWILITIIGSGVSYGVLYNQIAPVYRSIAKLYVVPGVEHEQALRAENGGLKEDFAIIFKSQSVITEAQKLLGTSENLADYLTVSSPADSNIIELVCENPDQNTAKKYVDAVAESAMKTTNIIPVEKISILQQGTATGIAYKTGLMDRSFRLAVLISLGAMIIEIIIALLMAAFHVKEENDEADYERFYGMQERLKLLEQKPEADKKRRPEPEEDILIWGDDQEAHEKAAAERAAAQELLAKANAAAERAAKEALRAEEATRRAEEATRQAAQAKQSAEAVQVKQTDETVASAVTTGMESGTASFIEKQAQTIADIAASEAAQAAQETVTTQSVESAAAESTISGAQVLDAGNRFGAAEPEINIAEPEMDTAQTEAAASKEQDSTEADEIAAIIAKREEEARRAEVLRKIEHDDVVETAKPVSESSCEIIGRIPR